MRGRGSNRKNRWNMRRVRLSFPLNGWMDDEAKRQRNDVLMDE